jgi:hypothetical protein
MLFPRRLRPREFSYTPRFYKEEEDTERRIQFRRKTLYNPREKRMNVLTLFVLLVLVTLLIGYIIPKLGTVNPEDTKISPEDVIVTPIDLNE